MPETITADQATEVPWYCYPEVLERFRKDTADHQMSVLWDRGVYRHIVFRQPGSSFYWYELITTPGLLTIRGDMGTYVFARVDDMFEFFDGEYINPGYWGEKLQAHSGYREYSEDRARNLIREHFDECKDRVALLNDPDDVWAAIEGDVLNEDVLPVESEVRWWLNHFSNGMTFTDTWEWDLKDFTVQYLWCCHAIQQGIKQYRALE